MADNRGDALEAALKLLSYSARSARELARRLAEKGYAPGAIEAAIAHLAGTGYIDDEKFAESLAESRIRNKRWGPSKVARDLVSKGISQDIIKKTLGRIGPREEEAARAALDKWARKNGAALPPEGREFERAFRHLSARGFSTGVIIKVLASSGIAEAGEEQ